jgi:2-keto-4-pentenoate hydratase
LLAVIEVLARRLDDAWERREAIEPLSATDGITTPELAYPVQRAWHALRSARGERTVGRKLGLTNRVIQELFGATMPDHGYLWESRYYRARAGRAEAPFDAFIEPRVEGEIAFLIGRELRGPGVTPDDVLAATEALAPALEIIDSRTRWQGQIGDTIADNASYGGFTHGEWSRALLTENLRTVGMLVERNGEIAIEGVGAGSLGNPVAAVAWLVNELATWGESLHPGQIVISGSLGRPVPVVAGDQLIMELHGQPPLTLTLTSD